MERTFHSGVSTLHDRGRGHALVLFAKQIRFVQWSLPFSIVIVWLRRVEEPYPKNILDIDSLPPGLGRTGFAVRGIHKAVSIVLQEVWINVRTAKLVSLDNEVLLRVNKYHNSCSLFGKCCYCCLWLFEKVLIYVNCNVYVEIGKFVLRTPAVLMQLITAIYGESFCKSARRAFNVISANAMRVAMVNSVGDFLLFISKLIIGEFRWRTTAGIVALLCEYSSSDAFHRGQVGRRTRTATHLRLVQ